MSEKPKTALAATSILALAVATAALALSGYGVYQASQGPTTEALDELENKLAARLAAAQEQLDGSFENRVEAALESIVASRQEAKRKAMLEAKAQSGMSSEGMLSMNDDGQVVYGNPDAAVTVYTFEDFRCGFCERYHTTMQQYVNNSDGQVNWVYKPYPILGPASLQLAAAAECVAQVEGPEAFWRFSEQAYATKNWITALKYSDLRDVEKISSCVSENTYGEKINQSLAEGRELGVTGTPASIFRNNKTEKGALIPGLLQPDQIAQMVEEVAGER